MNARDELAVILETEQEHGNWPETPDLDLYGCMADAILAAGYRKPRTVAYVVVDRDGAVIRSFGKNEREAKGFAVEWTSDCKKAGIDWDYRVAEITELAA